MCICSLPAGVVASMPSARLTKAIPQRLQFVERRDQVGRNQFNVRTNKRPIDRAARRDRKRADSGQILRLGFGRFLERRAAGLNQCSLRDPKSTDCSSDG
jgi:hypothetical protein